MPYITQDQREVFDSTLFDWPASTAGELNYLFTRHIVGYYKAHGISYDVINDIVGALEGAKLEFYRRIAAPYEDGKREKNGEVY